MNGVFFIWQIDEAQYQETEISSRSITSVKMKSRKSINQLKWWIKENESFIILQGKYCSWRIQVVLEIFASSPSVCKLLSLYACLLLIYETPRTQRLVKYWPYVQGATVRKETSFLTRKKLPIFLYRARRTAWKAYGTFILC